ncbi:MAG TPA: alpha/beta hydrolase family protein [Bacteroidales bacterium]|jgi:dienelactone hydrolase|nr:alpha/beta hydrolase family protein [Bacteroidales bacterium]HQH22760.1 alpha/beta hydrolase family protein [Bacteroidales bacterium]HQJ83116.1 alpha/beta hydrolase family protein [Bacteroidales bacterium]
MKTRTFTSLPHQGRRNFLKSNFFLGLAALSPGLILSGSCTSGRKAEETEDLTENELLEKYLECLGGPFPEAPPLNPVLRETIRKDGYRIESVTYEGMPGERIPAFILIPDGIDSSNPAPGIAVWHQHNGEYHLGKSEPAGLAGNPMHHTGVALVREGYVVLCPDSLCFEERQDPTGILKGGNYERFEFLREVVRGRCLAWKDVFDMKQSVSMLCDRPEVRKDYLGCYGHSMGSTHAWLVGPLEPRLKCVIGNCCLPTYEAIEEEHLLHCFPNFVPGWKKYGDTPEIAALIAPRALHLNLGEEDDGSPIESARRGIERIAGVYEKAGVPENFTYFIEAGAGHVLSEAMWDHVRKCFARHLGGNA